MAQIQVEDKPLLEAVQALTAALNRPALHENTPMTNDDIYEYCNRRLPVNRILTAMKDGEIKKCAQVGNKYLALKKHVDKWLDSIFEMQRPGRAVGGLDVIPTQHTHNLLKRVL